MTPTRRGDSADDFDGEGNSQYMVNLIVKVSDRDTYHPQPPHTHEPLPVVSRSSTEVVGFRR